MKRKIPAAMTAFISAALLLSGCGNENTTSAESETTESIVSVALTAESVEEEIPEGTENTDAPSMPASIEMEHGYVEDGEYADIVAHAEDGSEIWRVQDSVDGVTELDTFTDLGQKDEAYYFVSNGSVVALNVYDGSELWRSTVNVGSPALEAFLFSDDYLYISGYYGPDLTVLTYSGECIYQEDTLDEDYYWPYKIEETETQLLISMEAGPDMSQTPAGIVSVDKTWTIN